MYIVQWRKSTNESQGKPAQKFTMWLLEQSSESISISKNFLLNKAGQEIINHLRMYRKYRFDFIGLEENIHPVTLEIHKAN
jgi:hypothetical protein